MLSAARFKLHERPPLPEPTGLLFEELNQNNLELIPPPLGPLLNPEGTWNGDAPVFGFRNIVTGEVYSSLSEVPRLEPATVRDLDLQLGTFINREWIPFLTGLSPQEVQVETIFQLDPNQLLKVSGGFKVVLRRPLDGWYSND